MVKEKRKFESAGQEGTLYQIVLYNDEVNTFDFVIESLIEVCGHEPEQAEQCAMITHYKGQCGVHSGAMVEIEPLCKSLNDRGLTAGII